MKNDIIRIPLAKNPLVFMDVRPGHFTTGHVHMNYYLDVSTMKANALVAKGIAHELAIPYSSTTAVDTIICMEDTKVIGAFLAEELSQHGTMIMNSDNDIHVITPKTISDGKLTFYDNEIEWVENKNILLLTATISSGQTLNSALECITYYKGIVTGISSLFLASDEISDDNINALFTADDVPGYKFGRPAGCELCKMKQPLDAYISSDGYKEYRG